MVMVAEASYHQVLRPLHGEISQPGGREDRFIRLQDKGIHGNGHMVMIEKNNLEIAKLLDDWMQKNVK